MIRAILAGMISVALLGPAIAGDITPRSPTAGSTLDVIGPGGDIEPGERTELKIEGLTLAEVQEAMSAGRFDLTVFPLAGTTVDASYDWLFGQLEIKFEASRPGDYLVKMILDRTPAEDDPFEVAATVVTVAGDGDEDDTDDGDDDSGPPSPPIPSGRRELIVVWESGEPSAAVAAATLSAELKAYLASQDHHLWIVDQDAVGPDGKSAPAGFAPWIQRATAGGLPRLFITAASPGDSSAAEILYQGPPPATADAWLALIKKHGG